MLQMIREREREREKAWKYVCGASNDKRERERHKLQCMMYPLYLHSASHDVKMG